jgi:hypothetical protein
MHPVPFEVEQSVCPACNDRDRDVVSMCGCRTTFSRRGATALMEQNGDEMRKLLMGAAAIALPAGILASSAGVASATKPTPVNLTNASVTCTGVTGAAKFAPRITTAGGSPENVNIKLLLSGCAATGATVNVTSGKGAGVLHLASNSASTLDGTNSVLSGHINIKWSTSPKPTFKESTVTVTAITGAPTGGGFASFAISAGQASVVGDFQGTDNGASSSFYAETTQSVSDLSTDLTGKGIKIVNFGPNADAAAYHLTLG